MKRTANESRHYERADTMSEEQTEFLDPGPDDRARAAQMQQATKDTKPMVFDNLHIWGAAGKTDRTFTKQFTRRGGFSGTAINSMWLINQATRVLGPCGLKWGWEIEECRDVSYVGGILNIVRIRLWYVFNGHTGSIQTYGQTQVLSFDTYFDQATKRKKKVEGSDYIDEDYPKKSLTDAITKALSYLGFGADVHLGLWDDNKYAASHDQTKNHTDYDHADYAGRRNPPESAMPSQRSGEQSHPLPTRAEYIDWWHKTVAVATSAPDLKRAWFAEAERRKLVFPEGACPEIAELYDTFIRKGQELAAGSRV